MARMVVAMICGNLRVTLNSLTCRTGATFLRFQASTKQAWSARHARQGKARVSPEKLPPGTLGYLKRLLLLNRALFCFF